MCDAAAAAIRAQITAKEIQLTAMRSFATDENPDLKRTYQELAGLRSELAKLETGVSGKGDVMVSFGKAPIAIIRFSISRSLVWIYAILPFWPFFISDNGITTLSNFRLRARQQGPLGIGLP